MSDDEVDFSQATPTKAGEVVEFFNKPIAKDPEMPTFGPADVEALAETPLAYSEICEKLLKELYTVSETRKKAEKYEKELKEEFKRLVGKDRGMIQKGAYGCKVMDRNGATTTNWPGALTMIRAWAVAEIGDAAKDEISRIVTNNQVPGVPGIAITPYRVGKGDPEVE